MEKFYFTWGQGHHDVYGRSLMGWYTIVQAKDMIAARQKMFEQFGPKWSFGYTEEQFAGQIERFNLQYEPYELVELCCQISQQDYLKLKAKVEKLENDSN